MTLWTTDRPTVPGWYWCDISWPRSEGLPRRVVEVRDLPTQGPVVMDEIVRRIEWAERRPARQSGPAFLPRFAGPITPPPPAPEFPTTAEALALAVLAGDMVAARALADWVTEHIGG